MKELIELLEELGVNVVALDEPTQDIDIEIAYSRYRQMCRSAYKIMRYALEKQRTHVVLCSAVEKFHKQNADGAMGALLLEAFRQYVQLQEIDDPETFKEDIIAALDMAVQVTGHELQRHHDSSTKQSTTDGPDLSSETT